MYSRQLTPVSSVDLRKKYVSPKCKASAVWPASGAKVALPVADVNISADQSIGEC